MQTKTLLKLPLYRPSVLLTLPHIKPFLSLITRYNPAYSYFTCTPSTTTVYPSGFDLQILNDISDAESSDYAVVERTEINNMIKASFPANSRAWISNLDRQYTIPSSLLMSTMISMDQTNLQEYITDFYDCDDFSFNMFGDVRSVPVTSFVQNQAPIAFGVVFGTLHNGVRHAANVYVTLDEGVVCLEPQNDGNVSCDGMFKIVDTLII